MKSKLILCLSLFLSLYSGRVLGQHYQCGTDEHYNQSVKEIPGLIQIREQSEKWLEAQKNSSFKAGDTTTKIIPVVVHVIHNYGPENLSDKDIKEQLATLNESFRKLNADTSNIQSVFKSRASDMKYQFKLATIDPNGNCTDGIVRVVSTKTYEATDAVKAVSYWDNKKYLNIWVVYNIDRKRSGATGIVVGYAQFPDIASSSPKTDGVVVVYWQMKKGNKTLTHEIGHWMNLLHPFGYGSCSIGADAVDDTPPSYQANYKCPTGQNSCKNDKPDLIDNIENFMDYSDCTCMFTNGQKTRADNSMAAYRSTIYSSSNLKATGVSGATGSGCTPKADFYFNSYDMCAGKKIIALENCFNSTPTKYDWTFTGGNPSTSTDQMPSIQYDNEGTYGVSLKASNGNGSDTKTKNAIITVHPQTGDVNAPYVQNFNNFQGFTTEKYKVLADVVTAEKGWVINNNTGYKSSKSLYINNEANTFTDVKYSIVFPSIDMTKALTHFLTFKIAYAQKLSTDDDNFKVYTSSTCGQTWQTFSNKAGSNLASVSNLVTGSFTPNDTNQWRSEKLNLLSQKKVANLWIKFEFISGGGNNIFIDDINIGQGLAANGIAEIENSVPTLEVYPNPASNDLHINADFNGKKNFILSDIQGRIISSGLINANDVISLSTIKNGIYLLKVDGYKIQRIIKN